MANLKSIAKKIKKARKVEGKIKKIVEKGVEQEKNILLAKFEAHEVTKEILGGENSNNTSGTLIGYGNLFSFIGFRDGENPIPPVRRLIQKMTKILSIRKAAGNKAKFNIKIGTVGIEDFRETSPLPWEPGRSWVEGIERGISGFGYYLNAIRDSSRSGKGIQTDKKVRVMAFRNVKYMSELIREFTKKVRKIK